MTHAAFFRGAVAAVAMSAVSGCAALTAIGEATEPLEVYELRTPAEIPAARGRPLARDVIVEIPTTSGALETDRIMIRPSALQAQYLPEVRWSEPAPVMVQTLMLRSIEASQGVRYVGRTPLGASGDYAVVTELTDFQAEVGPDSETAVVRLRFVSRIVRESDASIVASRTFTASAPAPSTETDALVGAFDAAAGEVFPEFAAWIVSAL